MYYIFSLLTALNLYLVGHAVPSSAADELEPPLRWKGNRGDREGGEEMNAISTKF